MITTTSHPIDDTHENLVMDILEHLSKQVEDGGSRSQPTSVAEMSRIIVDFCINTYERRRKQKDDQIGQDKAHISKKDTQNNIQELSIRQIFSRYINKIVRLTQQFLTFLRQKTKNQFLRGETKRNFSTPFVIDRSSYRRN